VIVQQGKVSGQIVRAAVKGLESIKKRRRWRIFATPSAWLGQLAGTGNFSRGFREWELCSNASESTAAS
jgi:hypothetical protein